MIQGRALSLVCHMQVDPDTAVRDAAFQCHDAYLRLLTANSQKLKQDDERQRTEAAAAPEKDTMFGSESVS